VVIISVPHCEILCAVVYTFPSVNLYLLHLHLLLCLCKSALKNSLYISICFMTKLDTKLALFVGKGTVCKNCSRQQHEARQIGQVFLNIPQTIFLTYSKKLDIDWCCTKSNIESNIEKYVFSILQITNMALAIWNSPIKNYK